MTWASMRRAKTPTPETATPAATTADFTSEAALNYHLSNQFGR